MSFRENKDAILVHAIGQQFNWNFHLPGPDGVFGRREVDLVTQFESGWTRSERSGGEG